MPNSAPSGSAMTMASAAAMRVFLRPGRRYVCQARESVKKGRHLTHSSWFLSARLWATHQTRAARATRNTTVSSTLCRLARGPGASYRADEEVIA